MLAAVIPLALPLAIFKWYCCRTFDKRMHYYCEGLSEKRQKCRSEQQFVHFALSEPPNDPQSLKLQRSIDGVAKE